MEIFMHTQFVNCVLASGFFDNEIYVILGESSAIVNRSAVEVFKEPQGQAEGEGRVCVYIIERKADRDLVEIPGQPVVGGLRTWIPRERSTAAA